MKKMVGNPQIFGESRIFFFSMVRYIIWYSINYKEILTYKYKMVFSSISVLSINY